MFKPRLKPIPGFACYYADDFGTIWSAHPSRWGHVKWRPMRTHTGRDGYLDAHVTRTDGAKKNKPVHVLVGLAFLGERPRGFVVRHLDGNKLNNLPANLAYGTSKQNMADARLHGTLARGERAYKAKLTEVQAIHVLARLSAGEPRKVIARELGVGVSTLDALRSGRTWSHLSTSSH